MSWVAFVNSTAPYPNLMQQMIRSLRKFSTRNLILQCIDFPNAPFQTDHRVQVRHVTQSDAPNWFRIIYHWKPWIIQDSIAKGLQEGIQIEADHLLTPNCDDLWNHIPDDMPISTFHPDQPIVHPTTRQACLSNTVIPGLPIRFKTIEQTQPYVQAGPILFRASHQVFLNHWMTNCKRTAHIWQDSWDESAFNCTLWLSKAHNHQLPQKTPNSDHFQSQTHEERKSIWMYHGSKDVEKTRRMLDEMILTYDSYASSPQSSPPQTSPCEPSNPPCEDASPCEPSPTSCETQSDPTCST